MLARPRAARAVLTSVVLAAPLAAGLVLHEPSPALADERVGFGQSVVVGTNEVVDAATSFGGDVSVDGEVRGDVTSFGGAIVLGPHAHVHGDVATMGGALARSPGAIIDGSIALFGGADSSGGWQPAPGPRWEGFSGHHGSHHRSHHDGGLAEGARTMFESLVAHGLLFLLALVLSGLFPERMTALHKAIIREPMRSGALGMGSYVAAIVLIIALTITVLGIPAAVVLAFGMPIATYVGLAACATVLGAAIPSERLTDRPILRLAAGVGVLFIASLVPFVGPILVAITACIGVGALVRTRFRTEAPRDLAVPSGAAYR
ncbi:MAG: polymer-forming cytoskeletal protein [Sandaracinaceae bacterium]|nr:polymer-forming cytoskeletal protein [Sandaracinaceae bacterium]